MNPVYRIVIVDDDESLLEVLTLNLNEDFDVVTFSDAPTALGYVMNHPVDAMILDYHLGSYGGEEMILEFQAYAEDIPIVVLSGDDEAGHVVARLQKNMLYYLLKPVGCVELTKRINGYIQCASL